MPIIVPTLNKHTEHMALHTETQKLAQIADISRAIAEHIEMFGNTDSLEGALTMATTKALKDLELVNGKGDQKRALIEIKFF